MKSFNNLILGTSFLLFCTCQHIEDSEVFNGEMVIIEDNIEQIQNVSVTEVFLDGTNYGYISAYDSLLVFMNPKLENYFFNIFNVKTGEELGHFIKKGLGPDELIATAPINLFFKESDELKTILFAPNEEKIWIWNISQSLKHHTTIIDTVYTCQWKEKGICYNEIFCNKDTLLMKVPAFPISETDATLPYYQLCKVGADTPFRELSIYKKSIKNSEADILPELFYYSNDALKPDGTKIAQAMTNLPQINIIDIKTGKVTGYRLKDGDDFSIFQSGEITKSHFIRVKADDNYIYAVYWGKEKWGLTEIPYVNTIYVFSWEGQLVNKIRTDCDIDNIFVDNIQNRLYLTRPKHDEVYYLDLSIL